MELYLTMLAKQNNRRYNIVLYIQRIINNNNIKINISSNV